MSCQNNECQSCCKDLVVNLLQAMTTQNQLMTQIVDQNNELIALLQSEDHEGKESSGNLDD